MLMEICERCDSREHHWNVREARIEIGELNRKPHLCEECTVTVMSVVLAVLRPVRRHDEPVPDDAVGQPADNPIFPRA